MPNFHERKFLIQKYLTSLLKNKTKKDCCYRRIFNESNEVMFLNNLNNITWSDIYEENTNDVNAQWEKFSCIFHSVYDLNFPLKKVWNSDRKKKYHDKDTELQIVTDLELRTTADKYNKVLVKSVEGLSRHQNVIYNCQFDSNSTSLFVEPVDRNEIFDIVKCLKNKRSSGEDEVSSIIIKKCIKYIEIPLLYIINNSLKYVIYPDQLKTAIIIPVYKKNGDQSSFNSFRPINLLSVFSKMFQMVMNCRIWNFLEPNNVFRTAKCRKRLPNTLNFGENAITISANTCFLGLELDSNLKWDCYINYLRGKLSNVCYWTKIVAHYLDKKVLKVIYHSNFETRLRYGILFFGNCSDFEDIFVIQKSTLRYILGLNLGESCRGKFRELGILTAIGVFIQGCVIYLFKNKQLFVGCEPTSSHTGVFNYIYPRHRLKLVEKGPQYTCIRLFNQLPKKVKEIDNVRLFKKKMYKLLVKVQPYTLEEFLGINLNSML
nr:unnamed protein product [Callosobruchus analis]